MSELQKYVALGPLRAAHAGDEINEHIWYAAPDVDARLAAKDAENARIREAMEALLAACLGKLKPDSWNAARSALENYAPAAQVDARLALMQRAVEWLLGSGVLRISVEGTFIYGCSIDATIPEDLRGIISSKPREA